MKKVNMLAAVCAAISMGSVANAQDAAASVAATDAVKSQCVIKVGNHNVITDEKGDCKTSKHDCHGMNKVDDKGVSDVDTFIMADEKDCTEVNKILNDAAVVDKAKACDESESCKKLNDKQKVMKDGKEVEVGKIDFAKVQAAIDEMKKEEAAKNAPAVTTMDSAAPAPASAPAEVVPAPSTSPAAEPAPKK